MPISHVPSIRLAIVIVSLVSGSAAAQANLIIAHVADDQYNLCAPVKGEAPEDKYTQVEETGFAKAALVDTLRKAFAYCDAAYATITDATAAQLVHMGTSTRSRLSMLHWNTWHTWEHYGNLVTYLRINGIVPPSSEPRK
jgi:hypothetical protein